MPWLETSPMIERQRFVEDVRRGLFSMTELCDRYGISRKTGYKWYDRYGAQGRAGLVERSHAPEHCPHKITEPVARAICEARRAHPSWGPRKLLGWLARCQPTLQLPAASTAGDLLTREGLVKKRQRRRRHLHPGVVAPVTIHPNDIWTTDFKGQFRTGDQEYCYPLTVADLHSRFLLGCDALKSTKDREARPCFERLFCEYGLPAAMRSDNGVPFASNGLHGLSQLNVWWMRLGIQHQRIRPASPQENGAHERMHRTLKREATRPAAGNRRRQQLAFDRFRAVYNEERPHEALGNRTPASVYRPSRRALPDRLPAVDYPGHYQVRFVSNAGTFRFRNRLLFIANALKQHYIGLEEVADGIWSVYFCQVLLARLDERDFVIRP
jgi:transposase InsO family protein